MSFQPLHLLVAERVPPRCCWATLYHQKPVLKLPEELGPVTQEDEAGFSLFGLKTFCVVLWITQ